MIGSRLKLRLILKACFSPKSRPYETQLTPLLDNTVFCEAHCLFIFTLNTPIRFVWILNTNHDVENSRNSPFTFRPVVSPSLLKKESVSLLCFPMICRTMKALRIILQTSGAPARWRVETTRHILHSTTSFSQQPWGKSRENAASNKMTNFTLFQHALCNLSFGNPKKFYD